MWAQIWLEVKTVFLTLHQSFSRVQDEVSVSCAAIVLMVCLSCFTAACQNKRFRGGVVKGALMAHFLIQVLIASNGSESALICLIVHVFLLDAWIILKRRGA